MPRILLSFKLESDLKDKLINEAKQLKYEGNLSLVLRQILKRHYRRSHKPKHGTRR